MSRYINLHFTLLYFTLLYYSVSVFIATRRSGYRAVIRRIYTGRVKKKQFIQLLLLFHQCAKIFE